MSQPQSLSQQPDYEPRLRELYAEQEKFQERSDELRRAMKQYDFASTIEKISSLKQDLKQSVALHVVLQEKGEALNKERVHLERLAFAADSQMKNPQNINESQLPPPIFVELQKSFRPRMTSLLARIEELKQFAQPEDLSSSSDVECLNEIIQLQRENILFLASSYAPLSEQLEELKEVYKRYYTFDRPERESDSMRQQMGFIQITNPGYGNGAAITTGYGAPQPSSGGFGTSQTGGFGSTQTRGFGSTQTGGFGSSSSSSSSSTTTGGGFGSTSQVGFGSTSSTSSQTGTFGTGFGAGSTGQTVGFGVQNTSGTTTGGGFGTGGTITGGGFGTGGTTTGGGFGSLSASTSPSSSGRTGTTLGGSSKKNSSGLNRTRR